ncbi:MAG: AAA family ATPase [Candidatus Sulfotelmatobacter sp.]
MLTKIRAHNFKSLRKVILDLHPRNVLVGANMAGKSNLVDLFRFIYDMTFPGQPGSGALSSAVFGRGGFSELLWKGGSEQIIEIALSGTTSDNGPERSWEYEISIQGDPRGNFRVGSEWLRIRRTPDSPPTELIETTGSERYFCNPEHQRLTSVPDPTRSILEFEIPSWPGNFLRSAIAKWRFYELVPSLMRTPNQTAAATFLQEHGENLSQWLLNLQAEHYDNSFARIQQVLRDALPQVTGLFNSPTQQSTVALGSREKYLKRPITLSQMSAGELAFIAFLSLIYAPPDRAGSLYCIEDLENYLHPTLIETLLQVLRQSQEEWERKHDAPQIIMTTHSPLVVDKMKLDEIIFVEKGEGATVFTRPGDKSHLRKLLQDEELGLGDLVYSGALSDVSE